MNTIKKHSFLAIFITILLLSAACAETTKQESSGKNYSLSFIDSYPAVFIPIQDNTSIQLFDFQHKIGTYENSDQKYFYLDSYKAKVNWPDSSTTSFTFSNLEPYFSGGQSQNTYTVLVDNEQVTGPVDSGEAFEESIGLFIHASKPSYKIKVNCSQANEITNNITGIIEEANYMYEQVGEDIIHCEDNNKDYTFTFSNYKYETQEDMLVLVGFDVAVTVK